MMDTSERSFVRQINEHVENCQICQRGTLCDTAEKIIADEESRKEQIRQATVARRKQQLRP